MGRTYDSGHGACTAVANVSQREPGGSLGHSRGHVAVGRDDERDRGYIDLAAEDLSRGRDAAQDRRAVDLSLRELLCRVVVGQLHPKLIVSRAHDLFAADDGLAGDHRAQRDVAVEDGALGVGGELAAP